MSAQRRVLVVARTTTAVNRLFDILPLLSGDPRIETFFSFDTGSAFSDGLSRRLTDIGARMVPWDTAETMTFDLALAASDKSDLSNIKAPIMLFPHGAGPHRRAHDGRVSGLALVKAGHVVPDVVVVAHPGQVAAIRDVTGSAVPAVLVAGDPCLDRMAASRGLRDRYRAAFDVAGRDFIVLASTWGRQSLYGRFPDLPARVLGAVSRDRARVALVLHPNVWARHGHRQVTTWLRPAIDAGLIVVPPEEGWRAAVIAGDVVLSDHGSVTCYAAAVGRPVLLAADGGAEVVPGSPMDALRRLLPMFDHDRPLADQVGGTVATDSIFANRGRSGEILRRAMYEIIGLVPPAWPVRLDPLPVPSLPSREPTAVATYVSATARTADAGLVHLDRYPVPLEDGDRPGRRHLAVLDTDVDPAWPERAAVLCGQSDHPAHWVRDALDRYPGARVAAVACGDGRTLLLTRGATPLVATGSDDTSAVASAIYSCLLARYPLDQLRELAIQAGPTRIRVSLSR